MRNNLFKINLKAKFHCLIFFQKKKEKMENSRGKEKYKKKNKQKKNQTMKSLCDKNVDFMGKVSCSEIDMFCEQKTFAHHKNNCIEEVKRQRRNIYRELHT